MRNEILGDDKPQLNIWALVLERPGKPLSTCSIPTEEPPGAPEEEPGAPEEPPGAPEELGATEEPPGASSIPLWAWLPQLGTSND